jgi:hypothetical protein
MANNDTDSAKKLFFKKPAWLEKQTASSTVVKSERTESIRTPPPISKYPSMSLSPAGATSVSPIIIDENDMFSRRNDTQKQIQAHKEEKERKRAEKRKQKELEMTKKEAEEKESRMRKEDEAQKAAQSIEETEDLPSPAGEHTREPGSASQRKRDPKRRRISEEENGDRSATWIGSGSGYDSEPATPKNLGRTDVPVTHASIPVDDSDDEIICTGSQSKPAHPPSLPSNNLQSDDDGLHAAAEDTDFEDDEFIARARAQRREHERARQESELQRQTFQDHNPFSPEALERRTRFGASSPIDPNPNTLTRPVHLSSKLSNRDLTDPIFRIFISSKIPGTEVALVLRHYKQPLAQVRIGWLRKFTKHAVGLKHDSVFFTYKGRKVYGGVQTLASLGVKYEWKPVEGGPEGQMELNVLDQPEEGPGLYEEERQCGVHFVATTEEIEARENLENTKTEWNGVASRTPATQTEQEGDNIKIKACFRSKEFEDFKLQLKPVRCLDPPLKTRTTNSSDHCNLSHHPKVSGTL